MNTRDRRSPPRLERYIAAALHHPVDAVKFLLTDERGRRWIASKYVKMEELDLSLAESCALLLAADIARVRRYLREAVYCRVEDHISRAVEGRALGQIKDPEILYAVCRILKPLRIVETGVASGISSAFMLEALRRNMKGHLFSIDLPNYEEVLAQKQVAPYKPGSSVNLPSGFVTGWVIPPNLRSMWTLKIGLSSEVLARLLEELGEIDLFLHDSEHTYENMMIEFKTAWSFLRPGGCLFSHDFAWNSAFADFAHHVGREPIHLNEIGALLK